MRLWRHKNEKSLYLIKNGIKTVWNEHYVQWTWLKQEVTSVTFVKWHSPAGSIYKQIEQLATGINSYLTDLVAGWSRDISCMTSEIKERFLQRSWNPRKHIGSVLTWISQHCTQQTHYTRRPKHEGLQSYVRRNLHKQRKNKREREMKRKLRADDLVSF